MLLHKSTICLLNPGLQMFSGFFLDHLYSPGLGRSPTPHKTSGSHPKKKLPIFGHLEQSYGDTASEGAVQYRAFFYNVLLQWCSITALH